MEPCLSKLYSEQGVLRKIKRAEQTVQHTDMKKLEKRYCWLLSKVTLSSLNIKTSFLQGKFVKPELFVKPPKEAESTNIWKLKNWIYGLPDASWYWYLTFSEELIKLGGVYSQYNQGVFYESNEMTSFGEEMLNLQI